MKRIKRLLGLTAALLAVFALAACGGGRKDNGPRFYAFEVKSLEIRQQRADLFTVEAELNAAIGEGAEVYFTKTERIRDTDEKLPFVKTDGGLKADVTARPGDYFLIVKDGDRSAVQSVTIPKMSPYVVAKNNYNTVYYELDGSVSWSSFVDPEGKNVYRSASAVFDAEAEPVKTGESIMTGFSNDTSVDETKPYYYVVLSGKNGKARFVSYSFAAADKLYGNLSASIAAGSGGDAVLTLKGKLLLGGSGYDYAVKVRSGAEEHIGSNYSPVDGTFRCDLPLTVLTREGVWYDVLLTELPTGKEFTVPYAAGASGDVKTDAGIYGFREYEGLLKVTYEAPPFTAEQITLTLEGGKPVVTVSGKLSGTIASNGIRLLVRYQSGSEKVTLSEIANTAAESGKFRFVFDASVMTAENNWHDLDVVVGDKTYTLPADLVQVGTNVSYNGMYYRFREWENVLKIEFSAGEAL